MQIFRHKAQSINHQAQLLYRLRLYITFIRIINNLLFFIFKSNIQLSVESNQGLYYFDIKLHMLRVWNGLADNNL